MAKQKKTVVVDLAEGLPEETPTATPEPVTQVDPTRQLVSALVEAINATKPVEKKTPANRTPGGPWAAPKGEQKHKLKRKMFHHSMPIEERLTNDEIDLLNKIKPGTYCSGIVSVKRRKDKGLDIDYPVKTAAQRLRLVNEFGIVSFESLLKRLVVEAENPAQFKVPEELD